MSSFLFAFAIDNIIRYIQDEVILHILLADDIALLDETRVGFEYKLEFWKEH